MLCKNIYYAFCLSSCKFIVILSHTVFVKIYLFLFSVRECFASVSVCLPCACLVSTGARRSIRSPGIGVRPLWARWSVGAGILDSLEEHRSHLWSPSHSHCHFDRLCTANADLRYISMTPSSQAEASRLNPWTTSAIAFLIQNNFNPTFLTHPAFSHVITYNYCLSRVI